MTLRVYTYIYSEWWEEGISKSHSLTSCG